ncbi:TetR/AcrR family transcriptional regulator [Micromonospora sp. BQ11]|uniref:TetR/AcrR family transcriptional regulator n=1 Tax=Micromonospora sp. BQ11 TaxID=3452212 RepID=UPI003F8B9463
MTVSKRTIGSAARRRDPVLRIAVREFARHGLHGGSTARIAAEAGIAHSYLFKLFGTKRQLFLATTDLVYRAVAERFRQAVTDRPGDPLDAMGAAYRDLLVERDDLLVVLHGFAASGDPEIGDEIRRRYATLYRETRDLAGVDDERMRSFWAYGMLLTVAAATDLPALADQEPWIPRLLS